ncbi:MAG: hypothetical protein OEZ39_13425 [Gammaproteobacteria bacterium]|nr:hypothetical protein [Gammaproteobacteria bacterium]MDH5652851.1 hypothetical protein [Gammaproteobacteria bacterium]
MNCFNHPDKPAIGTCKACSKGLCMECATDLGHGLACKGIHETEVNNLNMIVSKSAEIYSAAPKNTMIAPFFYLFMGLVFAGFGYFSMGGVTDLPFVMGIGFIVFGIVVFVRNRAIFGVKKNK